MSVALKRRRDTATNCAAFTGQQAEIVVDTTNNRIIVHDGSTAGGFPAAKLSEVVSSSQIGAASGVASLDGTAKIPIGQIPAAVGGGPGAATPNMDGAAAVGTSTLFSRQDHVHPTDTSRAPLASPTFTGTTKTSGYTVATLPAGSVGMRAYVTDATLPTFLTALTGGGAVVCPAFYNGTAWVAG